MASRRSRRSLLVLTKAQHLNHVKPAALRTLCEQDSQWNQFADEWNHQAKEGNRFIEEVNQLERLVLGTTDEAEIKRLGHQQEIADAKQQLASSKSLVANSQWLLREQELKRTLPQNIDSDLQQIDGEIKKYRGWVHDWEKRMAVCQKELDQLEYARDKDEVPLDSHQIREDAMKKGYVLLNYMTSLMIGSSGVGKTCLLCLLQGKDPPPPGARTSTVCAEHPVKCQVQSAKFRKKRGRWVKVSPEQLLPMIGKYVRKNLKKMKMAIPGELDELLEQFEKSGMTTASVNVPTSSSSDGDTTAAATSSLPGRPLSQEDEAAVEEMVTLIFGKLEKVISGEELTEEDVEELFSSDWVYVTDSGGQPQFHELLPLFIRDISSLVFVTRLCDKLDDRPADEFYRGGEVVGKKPSTHLTTREQIKCLTTSLLSRPTESAGSALPKIIMVGTHRDRAGECPETLDEKNKQLLDIFGEKLEDHLIFHEFEKKLLFPLNTINPNGEDKVVAEQIQEAVETSGSKQVKFPVWWFILELLLQGLAKKLGKRVLTRKFCVSVAHALGFTERSFDAALSFFDELNIIKYFEALPDLVFVDSQVPLDNISDLVEEGYLLRHGKALCKGGNWKHFCNEGVVTLGIMNTVCKHFEPGVFESDQLLGLLRDRLVVVPLKPLSESSTDALNYFMPALMDILSQDELEEHRIFSSPAAPLLFRFSHGCRRAGVFCCLVVHLMQQYQWSIQHRSGRVIFVARNCVVFRHPKRSILITLIDNFHFFEAHIAADIEVSLCWEVCPVILKEVIAGIHAACEKLHYSNDHPRLAMFCPNSQCDQKGSPSRHAAEFEGNGSVCVNTSRFTSLGERHSIWLGEATASPSTAQTTTLEDGLVNVSLSTVQQPSVDTTSPVAASTSTGASEEHVDMSKPNLSNLTVIWWRNDHGEEKTFHLKSKIHHKWRKIGNIVCSRQQLEVWAKAREKDSEDCCEEVLSHWLDHPRRPYTATWDGLYKLLEGSELGEVATELQMAVNNAIKF